MISEVKVRFISAIDREYTEMMKEQHSVEEIKVIHDTNRAVKDLILNL